MKSHKFFLALSFLLLILSLITAFNAMLSAVLFFLFFTHFSYIITYIQEHPKPKNHDLHSGNSRRHPQAVY